MIAILMQVGADAMMDQTNLAAETPRQLQSKKLAQWQKIELCEIARKS